MGLNHHEEYKLYKTVGGWTEQEANQEAAEVIKLMFKDVHGKATLQEQVAIELDNLLSYNNIDYVPFSECLERATEIIKIVNNNQ